MNFLIRPESRSDLAPWSLRELLCQLPNLEGSSNYFVIAGCTYALALWMDVWVQPLAYPLMTVEDSMHGSYYYYY